MHPTAYHWRLKKMQLKFIETIWPQPTWPLPRTLMKDAVKLVGLPASFTVWSPLQAHPVYSRVKIAMEKGTCDILTWTQQELQIKRRVGIGDINVDAEGVTTTSISPVTLKSASPEESAGAEWSVPHQYIQPEPRSCLESPQCKRVRLDLEQRKSRWTKTTTSGLRLLRKQPTLWPT